MNKNKLFWQIHKYFLYYLLSTILISCELVISSPPPTITEYIPPSFTQTLTINITKKFSTTPTLIPFLHAVSISSGGDFNCALTQAGDVMCWGTNYSGQLGIGKEFNNSDYPEKIKELSNILSISSGSNYACALTKDGAIYCWGDNDFGQLGNGDPLWQKIKLYKPTLISSLSTGNKYVDASMNATTCAISENSTVKCWGYDYGDVLDKPTSVPVEINGLSGGVKSISVGVTQICALMKNGTIKCWGSNAVGQLGVRNKKEYRVPVDVLGLEKEAIKLSSGDNFTCALLIDGTMKC